ncbi:23S ribosomal RNA methyltransferase Erm [Saccharothrix deserti]|uniref:23S ribosomal RNA methyltransferase Erm n=1 Tax=Saccharothrix deserti TaxID=2593674 RepID=UPI00131C9BC2|nr:23S ribosomal RNA methyltransferase Erm [Saccharothrix deserti]
MRTHHNGRHENGQNFLTDRTVVTAVVDLVARTRGPILEIGSGAGALTLPLQALGRPLTGVEIDPDRVRDLRKRVGPGTSVVHADFLRHRLPSTPHVLVGNLPFHLTTAMLRRIVHADHWTDAVLLVQWEVARRRAGVGGATMMTAQWWPWYSFDLARRVPAAAFHPRPSVDGGLMTVTRRADPLVDVRSRRRYQTFVHRIFTGRGRGVPQVVRAAYPSSRVTAWARRHGITDRTLPRDLTAEQWAQLFDLCC